MKIINPSPSIKIASGGYTGNGSANRAIPHGLGRVPEIVIITYVGGTNWYKLLKDIAYIHYATASVFSRLAVTKPDVTNFYVGNSSDYAMSANYSGEGFLWTAIG